MNADRMLTPEEACDTVLAHIAPLGIERVSLLDATAMAVGSIIGSGIFSAPGVALVETNSVGCSLAAWIVGGVMATMSSLVYCELGAMLPAAGGDYV